MRIRNTALLAALLVSAPAGGAGRLDGAGARAAGADRADAQATTLRHLQNLIRINTENPPGNEIRTAMYFDSVLNGVPGIEKRILRVPEDSMRANFVARLRAANPRQRPVLVMGHMDVVGADTTRWETDAFTPVIRDGYLYGRGAIDDKGMLAATLTALVQLAQQRNRLDRDIIFFATAGEEGGPSVGVDWVIEHHRDLIGDAEFALNEGGRIRVQDGAVRTVNIQTTEKVYYNVIATATGTSGHGSVPLPDNALAALARAVNRVHEWRAPVRAHRDHAHLLPAPGRHRGERGDEAGDGGADRRRRLARADRPRRRRALARPAAQRGAARGHVAHPAERRLPRERDPVRGARHLQHAHRSRRGRQRAGADDERGRTASRR